MAAVRPYTEELEIAEILEDFAAELSPEQAERLYDLATRAELVECEALDMAHLLLGRMPNEPDDELGTERQPSDAAAFVSGWRALESDELFGGSRPIGVPGLAKAHSGSPSAAGLLKPLNPLRGLSLASIHQMKDRAGRVGQLGVADLLKSLLASGAQVHATGHSFGSKVILSATKHAGWQPQKVASMVLLQPAVSRFSFAAALPGDRGRAGYADVPDLVSQPIVSTYSEYDMPLRSVYQVALRRQGDIGDVRAAADGEGLFLALGGYGPAETEGHSRAALPAVGGDLDIASGVRVLGLDGSEARRIAGHSDVANEDTAWLIAAMIERAAR